MRHRLLLLILALWAAMLALPAWPDEAGPGHCNPVVRLAVEHASLQETLSGLAREHGFSLVFPDSVDQAVSLDDELPLDELLEELTDGVSSSFIYGEDAVCGGNRLIRLVIYPVGEQGAMPAAGGMAPGSRSAAPDRDVDYLYIEDMEQYVEDVLLRKRRPELKRMTPEQRAEYRVTKQRMKKIIEPKLKSGELQRERKNKRADRKDNPGETGSTE